MSALVSLTLTPMMCSRMLRSEKGVKHGRLYRTSERAFDAMLAFYERGLDWALAPSRDDAAGHGLDGRASTWRSSSYVPKGLFPQQDTGLLMASTEASQDVVVSRRCSSCRRR